MTTDVHVHMLPPSMVRAAQAGEALFGVQFEIRDGRIFSKYGDDERLQGYADFARGVEGRLANMDSESVDRQVLSFSPGSHRYEMAAADAIALTRLYNDEFAEIVAAHPSRFSALAHLPLQDPPAAVEELRRAVVELGFVGAIIGTHVDGTDWNDPDLFPILKAASDLAVPVLIHPTKPRSRTFMRSFHLRNLIGNPMETAIAFACLALSGVMDRLPDLTLILSHGGGFACTGIGRFDHGYSARADVSGLAEHMPSKYLERVCVDSVIHSHETLRQIVDRIGVHHVLLGSDYPADMGQPDPANWIRNAPNLSSEEKTAILSGNCERLFEA